MWRRGDGQPPPPSRGSHLRTRRVRASDRPAPEGGQIFPRGCQIFAPGRVSTRGHSWGQSFAGSEEEEELIVSARHQIGSAAPARDVRRSDPKGGSGLARSEKDEEERSWAHGARSRIPDLGAGSILPDSEVFLTSRGFRSPASDLASGDPTERSFIQWAQCESHLVSSSSIRPSTIRFA